MGEREGETLRREDHTQNLRFPLLRLRFLGRSLLVVSPSQDVAVLFLPHKTSERSRTSTKAAQKPYFKQSPLTPTVSRGSPGTLHSCEAACRRSRDLRTRARVELASDLADSAVRR